MAVKLAPPRRTRNSSREHHLHESPPSMTVPLWILAALSLVGGVLGLPGVFGLPNFLEHWLLPIVIEVGGTHQLVEIPATAEWTVMIVSTLVAIAGWLAARSLYKEKQLASDAAFEQRASGLARAIENKWYVDELYGAIIVRPLERLSVFLWRVIDAIIDGIAAMLGYIVAACGDLLRFFQTGNVRNYALMFFAGVVVFIWVFA